MKYLLSVALLFITSIVFASNLGQIRGEVRYNIHDTTQTANTNNTRYTDSFINYRINETQKEIVQAVLPIYTSSLIDAVTGQQEYAVSSDTIKIDKVVFLITSSTNSYRKLVYSTIKSLDNDRGVLWESLPSSLPMNFYLKGNNIGLVPAPSGTYAVSKAIKIYYYQYPTDMVIDTDLPFNNIYNLRAYHTLIILGTTIKCKRDLGLDWTTDQTMYNNLLVQMKNDIASLNQDSTVINVTK